MNPKILVWARETAGLSHEEAVQKLGISEARGVSALDRLAALEDGSVAPTRPLLVKMSKQYRRPLLTFYLSDVPRMGDRGEDYRTLPDSISPTTTALVDTVVRDLRVRQTLIREILSETGEDRILTFVGSMSRSDGVNNIVADIKTTLGFVSEVFRGKGNERSVRTPQGAFSYLRELAESAGIFVVIRIFYN